MNLFEPTGWTAQDESNWEFLKQKYKERENLSEEWIEKRKTASQKQTTAEGKPNPLYPRLVLEAENARLQYENAIIIARLNIMEEQMSIMEGLFQRVGILEGAYQSLALANSTIKVDYHNRLSKWLDKNKPRTEPPPPPPRAVGQIVAEDYPELKE